MKILSTDLNQNYLTKNRYLPAKITNRSTSDTFVKSNPSFKGGEQKILSQGSKTIFEYAAFLAAGFVAFKNLTGKNDDLKEAGVELEGSNLKDILSNIINQSRNSQENDEKVKELEVEIENLKQENNDLKAQLEEKTKSNEAGNNQNNTENTVSEAKEDFVKFPTRRGQLSGEQTKLKNVVTKINISDEYNAKLTEICRDILTKGSKDAENKQRTMNLTSELEACGDDKEKLKSVIDKYDVTPKAQSPVLSNDDKSAGEISSAKENSDNSEVKVFNPISEVRVAGPNVVDRIDLTKVPSGRPARAQKVYTSSDSNASNRAEESSAANHTLEGRIVPIDDGTGSSYEFNLPKGASQSAEESLSTALSHFERQYLSEKKEAAKQNGTEPEYVKWMLRPSLGTVRKDDIINEVKRCQNRGKISKYYQINTANAEEVAETINQNPDFRKMFTLHGSTKFIERFVDFESDIPADEQADRAMEVFKKTLNIALKHGVTMEEYDEVWNKDDSATEIRKGTNIIISPEYFTEEAKEIFGYSPVKIGICRRRNQQGAVICTVFPKGVY